MAPQRGSPWGPTRARSAGCVRDLRRAAQPEREARPAHRAAVHLDLAGVHAGGQRHRQQPEARA
ncbi:MAG: hypothetical protein ACK559_20135, partial [bacterium]